MKKHKYFMNLSISLIDVPSYWILLLKIYEFYFIFYLRSSKLSYLI